MVAAAEPAIAAAGEMIAGRASTAAEFLAKRMYSDLVVMVFVRCL